MEDGQNTGKAAEDLSQVPFFEAYFIAPQSISRDVPEGVFGITDRPSGAYTTLMLDTDLDLPLLQAVLSEAESRGHPKSQTKRIERISKSLPQAALKEVQWLSDLRRKHSKEAEWDMVEIVELAYIPNSGQQDILPTSSRLEETLWGYLIILRGQVGGVRVVTDIQNEMVEQGSRLDETTAGAAIDDSLQEERRLLMLEHERELRELQEEFRKAIAARDSEVQEAIQQQTERYESSFQRAIEDEQKMKNAERTGPASSEDAAALLKQEQAKAYFQEDIEKLSSERLEATQANDVELQEQVERQVAEMTELFRDLNSMVEQQEAAVYATQEDMDKVNEEIEVATQYARRAQRMRWLLPLSPFKWAAERIGNIWTGSGLASTTKAEDVETSSDEDENTPHVSAEDGERILHKFLSTFSNLS